MFFKEKRKIIKNNKKNYEVDKEGKTTSQQMKERKKHDLKSAIYSYKPTWNKA